MLMDCALLLMNEWTIFCIRYNNTQLIQKNWFSAISIYIRSLNKMYFLRPTHEN